MVTSSEVLCTVSISGGLALLVSRCTCTRWKRRKVLIKYFYLRSLNWVYLWRICRPFLSVAWGYGNFGDKGVFIFMGGSAGGYSAFLPATGAQTIVFSSKFWISLCFGCRGFVIYFYRYANFSRYFWRYAIFHRYCFLCATCFGSIAVIYQIVSLQKVKFFLCFSRYCIQYFNNQRTISVLYRSPECIGYAELE